MFFENALFVFVDFPLALVAFAQLAFTIVILKRLHHDTITTTTTTNNNNNKNVSTSYTNNTNQKSTRVVTTNMSKIFPYLVYESVFILVDCGIAITLLLDECHAQCFPALASPLLLCLLNYVGYNFLSDVSEFSSLTMQNIAALACLFMFEASSKQMPRVFALLFKCPPPLLALLVLLVSSLAAIYELFMFNVVVAVAVDVNATNASSSLTSSSGYELECTSSQFENTFAYKLLTLFSFGFYYGFMMLVMVVVNALIAVKIRRSLSKRAPVNTYGVASNAANKRRSAEKRLTVLVLVDCCNLIAGRLPMIVYYVLFNFGVIDVVYTSIPLLPILVSYNFKFFIFFKFNRRFRNETKRLFGTLWRTLKRHFSAEKDR